MRRNKTPIPQFIPNFLRNFHKFKLHKYTSTQVQKYTKESCWTPVEKKTELYHLIDVNMSICCLVGKILIKCCPSDVRAYISISTWTLNLNKLEKSVCKTFFLNTCDILLIYFGSNKKNNYSWNNQNKLSYVLSELFVLFQSWYGFIHYYLIIPIQFIE